MKFKKPIIALATVMCSFCLALVLTANAKSDEQEPFDPLAHLTPKQKEQLKKNGSIAILSPEAKAKGVTATVKKYK